jgi:hypothetical protein
MQQLYVIMYRATHLQLSVTERNKFNCTLGGIQPWYLPAVSIQIVCTLRVCMWCVVRALPAIKYKRLKMQYWARCIPTSLAAQPLLHPSFLLQARDYSNTALRDRTAGLSRVPVGLPAGSNTALDGDEKACPVRSRAAGGELRHVES